MALGKRETLEKFTGVVVESQRLMQTRSGNPRWLLTVETAHGRVHRQTQEDVQVGNCDWLVGELCAFRTSGHYIKEIRRLGPRDDLDSLKYAERGLHLAD